MCEVVLDPSKIKTEFEAENGAARGESKRCSPSLSKFLTAKTRCRVQRSEVGKRRGQPARIAGGTERAITNSTICQQTTRAAWFES